MRNKTSSITSLEAEILSLRKEIESLSYVLQKQAEKSEKDQKEVRNWQTKMLHTQQDRDDAKVSFH